MDSPNFNRVLLVFILALTLANLLRPAARTGTVWALDEAGEEVQTIPSKMFPQSVSFAVDGGTFFILSREDKRIYTYNRQGRLGKVYSFSALDNDLKVRTGRSSYSD